MISYLLAPPARQTYEAMLAHSQSLPPDRDRPEGGEVLLDSFFDPLDARASARAGVSAQVLPWRPNKGVYVLVDELASVPAAARGYLEAHQGAAPSLLATPGVAGIWLFGSDRAFPGVLASRCEGHFGVSILFLDDDPATVGARLAPIVARRCAGMPAAPLLAAPFESIPQWNWERFS